MELKYAWEMGERAGRAVLIVPLWNWNKEDILQYGQEHVCFNRTFMELKYKKGLHFVLVFICFNRTFMELK